MSRRHRSSGAVAALHVQRAAFRMFGTVAPSAAATWFERLLLTPSRHTLPTEEAADPSDGEHVRVPYGHGWISARSWGEGPTVLLMHGWGAQSAHLYDYVAPLRHAGFRVVAFDAPAHGDSDGVMTNLVDCSGALLQIAARVGPVHGVVAHSFAGPTAAFATRHGFAPNRMAFIGAPVSMAQMTHELAAMMGFPQGVSDRMTQRLGARLGISWDEIRTDRLLADAGIPLLLFHDVDDRSVPWHHGEALARAVPCARLVSTRGLGHRRIVKDPGVVSQVVEFLSGSRGL